MSPETQSFMDEFVRTTYPNPFNNRERVLFKAAAVSLRQGCGSRIWINCIRSLQRRAGYGSLALNWLCDLADKHGVTLAGVIEPTGTMRPRLGIAQLRSWYSNHGFTVEGLQISRLPLTRYNPRGNVGMQQETNPQGER